MTYQEAFEIIKNEMPYESGVINEALEMVENAVEKQIPKKPLKQKFGFCDLVGFFDFRLVCPECEQPIARYFNKKEYKPRYCHNCGQAIDWSDNNV